MSRGDTISLSSTHLEEEKDKLPKVAPDSPAPQTPKEQLSKKENFLRSSFRTKEELNALKKYSADQRAEAVLGIKLTFLSLFPHSYSASLFFSFLLSLHKGQGKVDPKDEFILSKTLSDSSILFKSDNHVYPTSRSRSTAPDSALKHMSLPKGPSPLHAKAMPSLEQGSEEMIAEEMEGMEDGDVDLERGEVDGDGDYASSDEEQGTPALT